MTETQAEARSRDKDHGAPHKRHRRRWIVAGVAVLVVLVVLIVLVAVSGNDRPAPPPLALPTAAGPTAAAGPVDGRWSADAGSVAGFRVRQTFLGGGSDVAGRTNAVTGAVTVSHGQLTAASFRIDLTRIKVNDKASPQFAKSLDTRRFPSATFTLTQPVTLSPGLETGATTTATATGRLTLHGVTGPVTFSLTGRRSGSALQATGSIPIAFADWGIRPPRNYGPLGSLDHHGVAEFLLILHRR